LRTSKPNTCKKSLKVDFIDFEGNQEHKVITTKIMIIKQSEIELLADEIITAAKIRGFLG